MSSIVQRLAAVRQRLREAERAANRPEGSVKLIAVGKTHPASTLQEAYRLDQRDFGENYLQEALAKQDALADLDIVWHFIGPIQSNKTRQLANRFDWIHGVDRLKIAQRLSEQRSPELPPLNVCIQVNVSEEDSKSGVSLDELPELAAAIVELPRLRLRGLMAIPAPHHDFGERRKPFRDLREAMERLGRQDLDSLSMGMSEDLEAAVMEGATLVRIGTAIFGKRGRKE
ncbi:MAG: YggS family pyridoxal phosphate-dependent enzyme [Methylococcaceae bacterium]|nr:YggS family pyridoxal phosphate-dependent enzyme [Methylococcaceae bacterium]